MATGGGADGPFLQFQEPCAAPREIGAGTGRWQWSLGCNVGSPWGWLGAEVVDARFIKQLIHQDPPGRLANLNLVAMFQHVLLVT